MYVCMCLVGSAKWYVLDRCDMGLLGVDVRCCG